MASVAFDQNRKSDVAPHNHRLKSLNHNHHARVIVPVNNDRRPAYRANHVQAEIVENVEHLPLGTRMAIILGGGVLGWALPIAAAWSFFR